MCNQDGPSRVLLDLRGGSINILAATLSEQPFHGRGQLFPRLHFVVKAHVAFTERRLRQLSVIAPRLAAPDSFMPWCDVTSARVRPSQWRTTERDIRGRAGGHSTLLCHTQAEPDSVCPLPLSDERQESCVLPRRLSDGPAHCDRRAQFWLGGERRGELMMGQECTR